MYIYTLTCYFLLFKRIYLNMKLHVYIYINKRNMYFNVLFREKNNNYYKENKNLK